MIDYLKEPKNWLVHALVGIVLIYFLLFAPLNPLIRIGIILGVVTLNVIMLKNYFVKFSPQKLNFLKIFNKLTLNFIDVTENN
ncbi:MAG: hypothetical protein ABFC34_09950 [Methanobacterium sp.]